MAATDKFSGVLGRTNAAHLLRRATFGLTESAIQQFASLTVDQAMDLLFSDPVPADLPIDLKTNQTWLNPKAGDANSEQKKLTDYFIIWHLERMRQSEVNISERLTYFYHTHLPVRRSLVESSEMIYYQNALFRQFAKGSFKTLFKHICMDNAMLIYLDNGTNDVSSPNENFAREMLELYSIGRGPQIGLGDYTHFTEDDIKAATRVLTGYQVDYSFANVHSETQLPTGVIREVDRDGVWLAHRHDAGEKIFSHHFGKRVIAPSELVNGFATSEAAKQEFDEMIEMIFEKDETARFITRKLYRFFVYYQIDDYVENNVIIPLAAQFKSSGYDMSVLARAMLSSQHFYDVDDAESSNNIMGSIIKSPIDMILGTLRLFQVDVPTDLDTLYNTVYINGIFKFIEEQGLDFYEPFEVAGYPAYHQFPIYSRNWIRPQTLAYRYKLSEYFLNGINSKGKDLGIKLDVLSWVENGGAVSNPADANILVDALLELMIPFPVASERRDFFLTTVFLDGLYPAAWTTEWNNYRSDPTQYKATVASRISVLINAIMQSPEYQLY
ncbi:DUF1800 domain-containing protein [Saccharicrinis fermentans]|uniref:DUF1800 domain-containing protein n=1 Tax=Saccharicrinis fermentans DSM 9555 = JCM 21142 TaxID=869213 RepID=W7YMF5_9BACT|nr:DUF1800 family protein [Saccharicrinis fermentans]GAF03564.1 hypothetical protein JCM21142_52242 [Saccharicrinis fermentans DSM 9555 = JCM 21142]